MGADRTEGKLHYEGWTVVAASAIAVFFVSIFFFTFPVFLKPLANEFAWSREAISAAYAALTLGSALSAPLIGFLVDRWGPRWICSVCLTVAGCVFASLGMLAGRLWLWYGAFAVIGVASAGTSSVVYSRVICSWFEEHRGRALAVMIAGSALGGIVVPPIAQALIDGVGWRNAYPVLGAGIPILAVPVVLRWVREKASREPAVAGRTRAAVGAALRSRTFWTLIVVVFGTTATINGAIVHLSALLTDRGMTASRAALVVSAMGVASLVGRLIAGWLLDRFVATRVAFVLLATAATGAFVLARAESFTAGESEDFGPEIAAQENELRAKIDKGPR